MTTPRLTLITIVATLAYLGLAILGWGGFAAFFSHSALIALAVVLFALSGVALFSGGNLSPGVREDRANRWVIVAFGSIGVLAAYLPAYTDRKGFWTVMLSAGLVSFSSLPVVHYGSGRYLCWVIGSAGWWPSSPATSWLRVVSTVSSVTRAIWGCSLTRWDGRSLFARGSGYCSQRCSFRRSSRAFVLRSSCCVRSSAVSTMYTAPARHGLFPGCIDAVMPDDPPAIEAVGAGWSSRKHCPIASGRVDIAWRC
jgi:hypothetical protein